MEEDEFTEYYRITLDVRGAGHKIYLALAKTVPRTILADDGKFVSRCTTTKNSSRKKRRLGLQSVESSTQLEQVSLRHFKPSLFKSRYLETSVSFTSKFSFATAVAIFNIDEWKSCSASISMVILQSRGHEISRVKSLQWLWDSLYADNWRRFHHRGSHVIHKGFATADSKVSNYT